MEKIKQCKMIVLSLFLAIGSIGMGVAGADIVTSIPTAVGSFPLSKALDGNPDTFTMILDNVVWVDGATIYEGAGSMIDVNFGEVKDITGIEWLPRQWVNGPQPRDFEVLVSNDGFSWNLVLAVDDAPPVPTDPYWGWPIPGTWVSYAVDATGRYLRFHVIETYHQTSNLQLAEIDFLTDVPSGPGPADATATSTPTAVESLPLSKALDRNPNTFTMILDDPQGVGSVIDVDFGEGRCINEINWLPRQDAFASPQPRDFEVLVSDDGISWSLVLAVVEAIRVPFYGEPYSVTPGGWEGGIWAWARYPVNAAGRYLRFHVIESYDQPSNLQLAELWFVTETVNIDALCTELGEAVDAAVQPIDALYKNHGDYVSRVAHFVEEEISTMCLTEEQAEELSSCVVHVRAQSDVGKKRK